jgi:cyclase
MQKLTEHVYIQHDNRGVNFGLIVTPSGTVLVDSPMLPEDTRAWHEAITQITTERPCYLINTDHHLGHSLGNWAFPDTPAITHRHSAFFMLEKYDDTFRARFIESFRNTQPAIANELEKLPLPHPRLGVGDQLTLHIGDFPIELLHVGGHTPGSIMVRVPSDDVLFTGDVVVRGRHPNLGDANSQQWLDALKKVEALSPKFIVPGHGDLATAETLHEVAHYVTALYMTVVNFYQAGLSRKDVVSKVKALEGFPLDMGDRLRAELRLKASLQRVYDELKERDKRAEAGD